MEDNITVLANEFSNFLCALLTCRLINEFDDVDCLAKYSYGEIMTVLAKAKKYSTDGIHWKLIEMEDEEIELLKDLEFHSAF